jgi:hypothetical protein
MSVQLWFSIRMMKTVLMAWVPPPDPLAEPELLPPELPPDPELLADPELLVDPDDPVPELPLALELLAPPELAWPELDELPLVDPEAPPELEPPPELEEEPLSGGLDDEPPPHAAIEVVTASAANEASAVVFIPRSLRFEASGAKRHSLHGRVTYRRRGKVHPFRVARRRASFSFGSVLCERAGPSFSFGSVLCERAGPSFSFGSVLCERAGPSFSFGSALCERAGPSFSFGSALFEPAGPYRLRGCAAKHGDEVAVGPVHVRQQPEGRRFTDEGPNLGRVERRWGELGACAQEGVYDVFRLLAKDAAHDVHERASGAYVIGGARSDGELGARQRRQVGRLAPQGEVRAAAQRPDPAARRVDEDPIVRRRHLAGADGPVHGERAARVQTEATELLGQAIELRRTCVAGIYGSVRCDRASEHGRLVSATRACVERGLAGPRPYGQGSELRPLFLYRPRTLAPAG